MKKAGVILFILVFSLASWAKTKNSGLSFHLDFGANQSQIVTSTQDAKYQGLDLTTRANIALFGGSDFSTRLNLGYKWAQLNNSSTSSGGAETANHSGMLAGIEFRIVNIFLGANVSSLRAKHISSASGGQDFDFDYMPMDAYGGIDFALSKNVRLSLMYSQVLETDVEVSSQTWKLSGQVFKIGLSFPTKFSLIGGK